MKNYVKNIHNNKKQDGIHLFMSLYVQFLYNFQELSLPSIIAIKTCNNNNKQNKCV